jgi:RES domain-containing protein
MTSTRRRRDPALIDAIEAHTPVAYQGTVWRVVREGRSPIACARSGGRWDDGTFDVLYTAAERDGAVAEMFFHLGRGQPVFPSQVRYELHEVSAAMEKALKLVDLAALEKLGMETSRYGQLSYADRTQEYPQSQDIAETAHFLDFDGLIVPNARWDCSNVILFCDRAPPSALQPLRCHGLVDWAAWARLHGR